MQPRLSPKASGQGPGWPRDLPLSTVRRAAQTCGLKEVGEDEEWTVYWTDCSVSLDRVMDMKRFQVQSPDPRSQRGCGPGMTTPTHSARHPRLSVGGHTPLQSMEGHDLGHLLQWKYFPLESLELLLSEAVSAGHILPLCLPCAWRRVCPTGASRAGEPVMEAGPFGFRAS